MEGTGGANYNKRNPSFELLRIIAMLMILTLHYNSHSGALLQLGVPATGSAVFANIMEAFCITGVNTYVLISGFFLSQGKVKISRLFQLICQVFFYTILVSVAMMLVGTYVLHYDSSVYKLVQYIFPISSEHYWFVTAYVIMYVLAPVMNAAMDKLTRKQMKTVILGLLIWFCFIKSIIPVSAARTVNIIRSHFHPSSHKVHNPLCPAEIAKCGNKNHMPDIYFRTVCCSSVNLNRICNIIIPNICSIFKSKTRNKNEVTVIADTP